MIYKNSNDLFLKNELKTFNCKICSETLKICNYKSIKDFNKDITTHIKKHDISKKEYFKKYPSKSFTKQNIEKAQFVKKMIELYPSNKNMKLIINDDCTASKLNEKKIFKDYIFHLTYKNTLAIFPSGTKSKFYIFKVNFYNDFKTTNLIAKKIINSLKLLLETDAVYVFSNGSNGYNITLFFDDYINTTLLTNLYNSIVIMLDELNLGRFIIPTYPAASLPMQTSISLPFGLNFLSNEKENFMDILNDDLHSIKNNVETFINISVIPKSILLEQLGKLKNLSSNKPFDSLIIKMQSNDKEIIKASNTRSQNNLELVTFSMKDISKNDDLFYVAFSHVRFLKHKNLNRHETIDKLIKWSVKQNKLNEFLYSVEEIEAEINNIINRIYNSKTYDVPEISDEVIITLNDAKLLFELFDTFKKKYITIRKIALAFIIHSARLNVKSYEFYITYNQIIEYTKYNRRSSIHEYIKILDDINFINIIREKSFDKSKKIRRPNIYEFTNIDNNSETLLVLNLNDNINFDNMLSAILKIYYEKNLENITNEELRNNFKKQFLKIK